MPLHHLWFSFIIIFFLPFGHLPFYSDMPGNFLIESRQDVKNYKDNLRLCKIVYSSRAFQSSIIVTRHMWLLKIK